MYVSMMTRGTIKREREREEEREREKNEWMSQLHLELIHRLTRRLDKRRIKVEQ
jgi:hypothetical protein